MGTTDRGPRVLLSLSSQSYPSRLLCYNSPMPIIECIPNVSEGRRADVIEECAQAIRNTAARLLDVHSDAAHNRTVYTFAGDADAVHAGVLALFDRAIARIDLRRHTGEHPRVGAVDVVPFVPIDEATMQDCVALARAVGAEVAIRHDLPIFLYEEAATSPGRRNLEDIRRGEFEGLSEKMARAEWRPDFGPGQPHPSAGASVIGARRPLIAYNINLRTTDLAVARTIAATVRHSSGGLRDVKAMGVNLADRGMVQVSMNLTNYEHTPMFRVFELVTREAARLGVSVANSEIVGLVPAAALTATAAWFLQLDERFSTDQILENRLKKAANLQGREPAS
jgi:glutamate formiminotransferase